MTDDRDAWKAYWQSQGTPWRTEPEISNERQDFLTQRLAVSPDAERGVYHFRDEQRRIKLTRADVEWLLATHQSGGTPGPVAWRDLHQGKRVGIDLRGADLRRTSLQGLPLTGIVASFRHMEAYLVPRQMRFRAGVWFQGADLREANLDGALLGRARFEKADLSKASLCGADLYAAHFEGTNLTEARLGGARLRDAYFDRSTYVDHVDPTDDRLGSFRVVDVRWGELKLATILWDRVRLLGDERRARQSHWENGDRKPGSRRLTDFERAVRANRQVALGLRAQGENDRADRFAYRAARLQRALYWRQGRLARMGGSWLLDVISGYGYKPVRSFLTYLLVITFFAASYFALASGDLGVIGVSVHHAIQSPVAALVFSITSFHGRGFFPSGALTLDDPITILASLEAIIGLFIEITFIATFTQRFFVR
jgi:uncharacterized protein YjbI with pentapeptide repeats